jgi:hypothetical protein
VRQENFRGLFIETIMIPGIPREKWKIKIMSQNMRGMPEHKLEMLLSTMRERDTFAYTLQETWRIGTTTLENKGFKIFLNGMKERSCNRGSGGVGIILSPTAAKAWEDGGSEVKHYGTRIVAVKLLLADEKNRPVTLVLVAAYSPIGAAGQEERADFFRNLDICEKACKQGEILLIGADANAAIGTNESPEEENEDKVLGPHGIKHTNNAGRVWQQFLGLRQLCAASTFFKKPVYGTWIHPYYKRRYQIDHFFVRRIDLKRVRDSGRVARLSGGSDHDPIQIKLNIARRLRRQEPRVPKTRIDRTLLSGLFGEDYRRCFRNSVRKQIRNHGHEVSNDLVDEDGWWKGILLLGQRNTFIWVLLMLMVCRNCIIKIVFNWFTGTLAAPPVKYNLLALCLNGAAEEVLETTKGKKPDWFQNHEEAIMKAVKGRNAAFERCHREETPANRRGLQSARQRCKTIVKRARTDWIEKRIKEMNSNSQRNPKLIWEAVKEIKKGFEASRVVKVVKLRDPETGNLCESPEDNGRVFRDHFTKVFNKDSRLTEEALNLIQQREVMEWLDCTPSVEEMEASLKKMSSGKAAGDNGIIAEFLKAMAEVDGTRKILHDIVIQFWQGEDVPLDWLVGRLKILPKKGDLSDPNKWRGIMLLDIMGKLVCSIISARLQKVLKEYGLEEQFGFMMERGCSDGIFTLKTAMAKRKEYNLETWALFIDLVKAFDTVPREGLFQVLSKFGVPDHLINLIKSLHTGFEVKLKVGKVDVQFPSSTGVKQGDNMAPILFLFYMQACLETLELPKIEFRTISDPVQEGKTKAGEALVKEVISGIVEECSDRIDCKCTGCSWQASGLAWSVFSRRKEFRVLKLWGSLYADDAGLLFDSRADMEDAVLRIDAHFKLFGLEMHIGRDQNAERGPFTDSKTEAMYCPTRKKRYEDADTSFLAAVNGGVAFTRNFCYLGSIFDDSLKDNKDINKRISKATAVFGALSKCVFRRKDVTSSTKRKVYEALVLSILLYGCECWHLTASQRQRLTSFHRSCVRRMCRVTVFQRIRSKELLARLELRSMDSYLLGRRLRWLGHMVRMDESRLPRQLLFSWLNNMRPVGRPQKTYGHAIRDDLITALATASSNIYSTLQSESWFGLAMDKSKWSEFCTCACNAV